MFDKFNSDSKREKRKFLAEKSLEVISEKGLSNFTMDDVARAGNISKGSLYNYYKNKDELIISAFALLVDKLRKTISEEIINFDGSIEFKAKYFAKMYTKLLNSFSPEELMRMFEILISSTHDKKKMEILTEIFTEYYKDVMVIWQDLFNSKTLALLFESMFDGLLMYRAVGVKIPDKELESAFEDIINKLAN